MPVFLSEEDDLLCLGDDSQASRLEVDCHQYSPQTRLKRKRNTRLPSNVQPDDFKTKLINFPGRSVVQGFGLMILDNLDL